MVLKLKPAVAITLLATACFAILWMRSQSYSDVVAYRESNHAWWFAESKGAGLVLQRVYPQSGSDKDRSYFNSSPHVGDCSLQLPALHADNRSFGIFLPHWLLVTLSGAVGVSILIKRPLRFSLRTLAIVSALVAFTLGLGVVASRLALE